MSNKKAPEGKIYECQACGKKSKWSHGYTEKEDYCDYDFDISCVLNSKLIDWIPQKEAQKEKEK